MMKLSDYVFRFVADQGVKNVYLLSGGGCMHLVDSVGTTPGLQYVCCLHEQAASVAAAAEAQYTENLGVALVTTGPGGTNAITGVLGAWIDSVPLVVISGQVKRADMKGDSGLRILGYQEADIIAMVKPITKYAATVTDPAMIRSHLEEAVAIARSGRPGPVWIDIPLDVQASMIDPETLVGFTPKPTEACDSLNGKIQEILSLLPQASRPVLLVGKGVSLAGAAEALESFRQTTQIPTLVTWRALDLFDENDPLFFGRPGSIGQRAANFIQQNADLIITIGARMDFGQIGFHHPNFARAAKKIVIDIDPAEIAKFKYSIDVAVCADAGAALGGLNESLAKLSPAIQPKTEWLERCKQWKNAYPVVQPSHHARTDYVSTYALVDVLSDAMTKDDLLVPGSSGMGIDIPMQAFRIRKGQRFIAFPGIGAMGFGIPSTIGACIGSGKRRTICTNGDGGFQLNIQDLETVVRFNLPIKYFVLNNAAYGSIKATQRNYFEGRYVASDPGSGVTLPDIIKIAQAYGFKTFRIKTNDTLATTVKDVLACEGPVICEVMVDPEETSEYRVSSFVREDGSMVSRPQEDLWPFLPRDEFRSNMIIDVLEDE